MSKYLDLAISAAKINDIKNLPRMSAVLVTKDRQCFIGKNRYRTHPLQKRFGKNPRAIFLHAEIDAIVQAIRNKINTQGASLYIARVLKNNTSALAKPCIGCQGAIVYFGIEKVEWTI